MKKKSALVVFIAAIILNFCSINQSLAIEENGVQSKYPDYSYEFSGPDNWESFNRKIFTFNIKANKYVLRQINIIWASVMPKYGMDRVESFYTNATYPVRLFGCLFQKDFKSSKTETKRFFINTTIGWVGLYDVALTKYKIEPRDEDMGQVLAHYNVKPGPYLVVPIVAQGNIRDIGGQVLNIPFDPTSYIVGPFSAASTGLAYLNKTTVLQPITKLAENYADPYDVSKQLFAIDKYIKNTNLDRSDVLAEKSTPEKLFNISDMSHTSELKPDVKLVGYKAQTPEIDAMRTIWFDNQNLNNTKWSELSVWNKSFDKKIKTSSVNMEYGRSNCKFRYIMQKDKTAPLAIIFPSIGEGIMSQESIIQAKILYDEGYSVVIEASPFNWEFVKSMPEGYSPGLPYQDAQYLRKATSKIIDKFEVKKDYVFRKKILVGTSFGAMTSLFVANQEETNNTLGISKYIAINPPIELFYALKQLDSYAQSPKNSDDIKLQAAIMSQKVIKLSQDVSNKTNLQQTLPFSEDEAKLAITYAMKQKLSDLVFTIENDKSPTKKELYKKINNMSFYDYANEYIITKQAKPFEQLNYDASLHSIANFLQTNKNYKIYQTLDDCFTSPEQLIWLKNQTHNKSVIFSNGSHLGYMYRKEFYNELQKDTKF